MKESTGPFMGMAADILSNHSKICEQWKSASQSYYGFKQKHGLNIPFLSPKRLAEQTGISEKTWERMRRDGSGPPFTKIGNKRIQYPIVELEKWFASHTYTIAPAE